MGDNKFNIFLMLVIIVIIVSLGILFSTKKISSKEDSSIQNNIGTKTDIIENNRQDNNTSAINDDEIIKIEEIITNELSLIKTRNAINDIPNQTKLAIALNKLKEKTGQPKNEKNQLISFTKNELENAYKETSLSKLEILHESINGTKYVQEKGYPKYSYKYENDIYTFDKEESDTYKDFPEIGHKIININKENDNYVISIKYMWGNLTDCEIQCVTKVYGKLYHTYDEYLINEDNYIGTLQNIQNKNDLDTYFNKNYDSLKNNLTIYTYVFTKINDEFKLVNYYTS